MSINKDSLPKLTDKEHSCLKRYLSNGYKKSEAYRYAYDCSRMNTASIYVEASKFFKNPKITLWLEYYKENTENAIQAELNYTALDYFNDCEELKLIALECKDKQGNPNVNAAIKADENKAKVCGLLCALSKLPARTLIDGDKIFTEFNGALAEQYVLQQLKTIEDMEVAYWISKSGNAEIDFIIQTDGYVIPVEVKANINLQAKSLKVYREKFEPEISIRTSLADFEINNGLYNIPLFMAGKIDEILK